MAAKEIVSNISFIFSLNGTILKGNIFKALKTVFDIKDYKDYERMKK